MYWEPLCCGTFIRYCIFTGIIGPEVELRDFVQKICTGGGRGQDKEVPYNNGAKSNLLVYRWFSRIYQLKEKPLQSTYHQTLFETALHMYMPENAQLSSTGRTTFLLEVCYRRENTSSELLSSLCNYGNYSTELNARTRPMSTCLLPIM